MDDNTTVTDAVETVEGTHPVDDAQDTTEPDDSTDPDVGEAGNAEAARYRRRLRETEKERDGLAARLEATQKQQVESLLAATGIKPAALWATTTLADLLDDDGSVDPEKITAAVQTARDEFGITPIGKGNVVPGIGKQPAGQPKTNQWVEAFKGKRK